MALKEEGVYMEKKDDNQGLKSIGIILSAGITMAASVLVGYFLGNWLDNRFGTKPWLTLLMFILGTAAGLKSLYDLTFPKKGGG